MIQELQSIKEQLFDAPTEVKSAFNRLISYFSNGSNDGLGQKDKELEPFEQIRSNKNFSSDPRYMILIWMKPNDTGFYPAYHPTEMAELYKSDLNSYFDNEIKYIKSTGGKIKPNSEVLIYTPEQISQMINDGMPAFSDPRNFDYTPKLTTTVDKFKSDIKKLR